DGRAIAPSFKPNDVEGQFTVRVTAIHEQTSGTVFITQRNVKHTFPRRKLAIAGAAAAAATIAVVLATRSKGTPGYAVPRFRNDEDDQKPEIVASLHDDLTTKSRETGQALRLAAQASYLNNDGDFEAARGVASEAVRVDNSCQSAYEELAKA